MRNFDVASLPRLPVLAAIAALSVIAGAIAGAGFGPAVAVVVAVGFAGVQVLMWSMWLHDAMPVVSPAADKVLDLMERSNERRGTSIRDESTGLLNRWYLERRLEEESARCKRYGYSMAVVVLKAAITDRVGISAEGWQVESASAAHRCAQVIRTVDLSASLAPFEFAICLVHCDREGAERAIERLIAELSEYECSAGVAVFPSDDCAARAMIELARVRSRRVVQEQLGA
jgi:GGDEF domain-containing protein